MSITSFWFGFFVLGSMFIYYKIKRDRQWIVLLLCSLFFYLTTTSSGLTMLAPIYTCLSAYVATWIFENRKNHKKFVLVLFLISNTGILVLFNYFNLFINTINAFSRSNINLIQWKSPVAISFYSLSAFAYVLNCYWGGYRQNNIFKLFLFIIYFPLMVSGPICEYSDISEELYSGHTADPTNIKIALFRSLWGVCKKIVVADGIAILSNLMFYRLDVFRGFWVVLAAIVFAVQLYFDFSGCMDIVIGVSRGFGIRLTENFNAPFFSRNIQEFWRRWHMSLGKWLKKYIMNPLLKSEVFVAIADKEKDSMLKRFPAYLAIMVVWTLMGLWHGDSWKYVVGEGWYFGLIIITGQMIRHSSAYKKGWIRSGNFVWICVQRIRTLCLFSIGMIFFNSSNLMEGIDRIKTIFAIPDNTFALFILQRDYIGGFTGVTFRYIQLLLIAVVILIQWHFDQKKYNGEVVSIEKVIPNNVAIEMVILIGLFATIVVAGRFEQSGFIYNAF